MAHHRVVHFGGQLVHPGQSFVRGEDPDGNAIYLTFTTEAQSMTTLRRSSSPTEDGVQVSELRWNGDQLGAWVSTTRSINRELPMSELAEVTRRPLGMRAFMSYSDGGNESSFMWVRLPGALTGDTHSYDLVNESSGVEIGRYRYHGPLAPPGGTITYATFEYAFHNKSLFLDAMMSLYINRYLDAMGRII
ncbi:unnamed protein product [Peniophora sp. CBMAI 1063]|nr:unnamed protein product [Peniophora sp. CBMAI 1063]